MRCSNSVKVAFGPRTSTCSKWRVGSLRMGMRAKGSCCQSTGNLTRAFECFDIMIVKRRARKPAEGHHRDLRGAVDSSRRPQRAACGKKFMGLLGTLVYPGAKQTHLLGSEWFGRWTESAWPFGTSLWRRTDSPGTSQRRASGLSAAGRARPPKLARPGRRRHCCFRVESGDCDNQGTFLAFSGDDHLAVFAAFEHSFEAIET